MSECYFYAVLAGEGVVLTANYSNAVYYRDHAFRQSRTIRKFSSLEDAMDAALDHLWDVAPLDRHIPEHLNPHQVYYAHTFPYNT